MLTAHQSELRPTHHLTCNDIVLCNWIIMTIKKVLEENGIKYV